MRTKKGRKQAHILSIDVHSTSKERVLSFVRGKLRNFDEKPSKIKNFLIVTPNPEIVINAQHDNAVVGLTHLFMQQDKELAEILNSANLSLPDGIGLAAAHKFASLPAPKCKIIRAPVLLIEGLVVGLAVLFNEKWLTEDLKILKGRETFLDLMKLANMKEWRVFLLGGEGNEVEDTEKNLQKSLKKVKIRSAQGPMLDKTANPHTEKDVLIEKEVIKSINNFRPHLLFVAYGAPKQEKWLNKWRGDLEIGGAMVVGGTFNYMAKKTALPPKGMEKLGLEWLWRLITQPKRAKRIFQAFPVFPLKVFWDRLIH